MSRDVLYHVTLNVKSVQILVFCLARYGRQAPVRILEESRRDEYFETAPAYCDGHPSRVHVFCINPRAHFSAVVFSYRKRIGGQARILSYTRETEGSQLAPTMFGKDFSSLRVDSDTEAYRLG